MTAVPSISTLLSQLSELRAVEVLNLWPTPRTLLDTIIGGGTELRGLADPQIVRFTQAIAAGSTVIVAIPGSDGIVAVGYRPAAWDSDVTSPLLSVSLFSDDRLLTPSGYPITKATGTIEVEGFEGTRSSIQLVVTNGSVFDAQMSLELNLILMAESFYDEIFRPIRNLQIAAMRTLARLARGG